MTAPTRDAEMQAEEAQPTAAPDAPALESNWEDLIAEGLTGELQASPVRPDPGPTEPDGQEPDGQEPEEPIAAVAPEQPTVQLPQSAHEWMLAIDASPGREAQVPAKLRVELRDLREQRSEQRASQREAQAADRARQEALVVGEKLTRFRQIHALRQEDPAGYVQWQDANEAEDADYRSYVANINRPQTAVAANPLAVIQEQNQDVLSQWNQSPAVQARVAAEVSKGTYGAPGQDGNWTARGLTLALRDVSRWLAEGTPAKPDPAAAAIEERRAATQERGAIPKPAGGGTPAAASSAALSNDIDELLTAGWREERAAVRR